MSDWNYEKAEAVAIISLQPAEPKKMAKVEPTVILFDGIQIKTDSCKSVWRRPGDAKSALRLHLENNMRMPGSWMTRKEWATKFMEEMQANGRLKFAPLELVKGEKS